MATDALLRVSSQGASTRRGADVLDADAPAISTAIKRALPFLMRRGISVTPKAVYAGTSAALDDLAILPGVELLFADGAIGHVALDRTATEALIDGVLGGDGSGSEQRPTLSPAQTALASRITQTVARCMAERLGTRFNTRVTPSAQTTSMPTDGVFFLCFFEIGEAAERGTIVLAVPRSVVGAVEAAKRERFVKPVPGVLHVVGEVEIDVSVRLGSVGVMLEKLARLAPGDVLLTQLPVSGSVTIHVAEKALFAGRPTSVGGRLAVKVEQKVEG